MVAWIRKRWPNTVGDGQAGIPGEYSGATV